jgi:hypothetical protein
MHLMQVLFRKLGYARKCTKIQKNARKCKKMQENARKYKEMQGHEGNMLEFARNMGMYRKYRGVQEKMPRNASKY